MGAVLALGLLAAANALVTAFFIKATAEELQYPSEDVLLPLVGALGMGAVTLVLVQGLFAILAGVA
jgi:hypothetical protein